MKPTTFLKYSVSLLVLTVVTTLVVACGNKNESAPQPVVIQQNNNCLNGVCNVPVGGTNLFQGESQDWYGLVRFTWTFLAQNAISTVNPYGTSYGSIYGGGTNYTVSPIVSYYGPVIATGTMSLAQASGGLNGSCQLPAGTYTFGTVTPGQWASAIVSGLRLQASGPVAVTLSVPQAMVGAKTGSQLGQYWNEIPATGRIFGTVNVETINGYPCNMSVLVQ